MAVASPSLCILIIDADTETGERLADLCEELGHEVDFAYGAANGIEACERLRPDVVFLDADLAGSAAIARDVRRRMAASVPLIVGLGSNHGGQLFDAFLTKSLTRHAVSDLLKRRFPSPS